eukprot:1025938-Pleurochrysis_carterae.AAC.1
MNTKSCEVEPNCHGVKRWRWRPTISVRPHHLKAASECAGENNAIVGAREQFNGGGPFPAPPRVPFQDSHHMEVPEPLAWRKAHLIVECFAQNLTLMRRPKFAEFLMHVQVHTTTQMTVHFDPSMRPAQVRTPARQRAPRIRRSRRRCPPR